MTRHSYYPMFLDLTGREVLVVGGGDVAARKIDTLLRYGATIHVVSKELSPAVEKLSTAPAVRVSLREFDPRDVERKTLAIAATNSREVNQLVAQEARSRGVFANVADQPDLCDFFVPATVDRGTIQIAVSTTGNSPALARRIRETLEDAIGQEFADVSALFGALREPAKRQLPSDDERKEFFDRLLGADLLGLLRSGNRDLAQQAVREICKTSGLEMEEELTAIGW